MEDPKLRLGNLLKNAREGAEFPIAQAASHIDVPVVNLREVEAGRATLKADHLQSLADMYGVRYQPILEAARDWNKAIFDKHGHNGVTLEEPDLIEGEIRDSERQLEDELIRAADDLAFCANVARELYAKTQRAALRARELLSERGVPVPDAPESEVVQCSGPNHDPRFPIRLGVDFALSHTPDEDSETIYFCSDECAGDFNGSPDFKVVQADSM